MRQCSIIAVVLLSTLALPQATVAKGSHFLTEGQVGIMSGLSDAESTSVGFGAGALFGVGGRPHGSWLRYYLLLEAVTGNYNRTHLQNFRTIELDRSIVDIGLGMRIVAPLTPNFRLFGDIEGVMVISVTDFSGEYVAEEFNSSELDGGLRFGLGLEFRPLEELSVGIRTAVTTAFSHFDDNGGRGWLIGFDSEYGHWETMAQFTVYY